MAFTTPPPPSPIDSMAAYSGNGATRRRGTLITGYDVALQIYDWDGDGENEVILLTRGELVELNGKTGKEKRRFPIPERATDCLVFVNLSGQERPQEIIVKDRYRRIWAYDYSGKTALGWSVEARGVSHRPPASTD